MKIIVLTSLAAVMLTACGEQISTGHRGVKTNFGEAENRSLPEGFYWYSPIGGNIIEMDARQQTWNGTTNAYTKDVQQASVGYSVSFVPRADSMHLVYKNVGTEWPNRLLMDVLQDGLKSVMGKWEAVELIANRDKVPPQIVAYVNSRVSQRAKSIGLPEDIVRVTQFAITNIDFTKEFERAVEAKVVAIQTAERSKNQTVQVEEQAKQRIISAEAEAKSMTIRAQALMANPQLISYEAVQKWNGNLPVYMGGDGPVPFLEVK